MKAKKKKEAKSSGVIVLKGKMWTDVRSYGDPVIVNLVIDWLIKEDIKPNNILFRSSQLGARIDICEKLNFLKFKIILKFDY